jgi:hypothetical protein
VCCCCCCLRRHLRLLGGAAAVRLGPAPGLAMQVSAAAAGCKHRGGQKHTINNYSNTPQLQPRQMVVAFKQQWHILPSSSATSSTG